MLKRNKRIITALAIATVILGTNINSIKAVDLENIKSTSRINPIKAPSLERNKLDYEGELTVAKIVDSRNKIYDKIEEYKNFFKGAQESKDFTLVSEKLNEFDELIEMAMDMGVDFYYTNSAIQVYNKVYKDIENVVKSSEKTVEPKKDTKPTNSKPVEIKETTESTKPNLSTINTTKPVEIKPISKVTNKSEAKPVTKVTNKSEAKLSNNTKNEKDDTKEKKKRISKEYYKNDILREALDAYANYEGGLNSKMRTHERRIEDALDFARKLEVAKKSNTVSKEALEFLDEKVKELNPLYTQLVNEGKNKKIEKENNKIVEPKVSTKNEKNDAKINQEIKSDTNIKTIHGESEYKETNNKKNNKIVEPKVSVKNEKNDTKAKQETKNEKNDTKVKQETKNDINIKTVDAKSEIEEINKKQNNEVKNQSKLVKTGSNIDAGALMQLGTALSIAGAFLIRKFKK